MSPLLKSVEKIGVRAIRRKRNPATIRPEDFFREAAELRSEFARLINASDPSRIAIIPSVSYGMATVSNNLKIENGDEIIVAGEQFPSNVYPWHRRCEESGGILKIVAAPPVGSGRGMRWNESLLEAINSKTRAVAIAHVHWADGTLFQLEALRKRTREVGALLIIDGTQSIGALPFNVSEIDPDVLVCAGYKWLLGPYSLGLAYYGSHFDHGKPIEDSWMNRQGSEDFQQLVNYHSDYQDGARRYDVGELSNFTLVPMLLRAIQQLNRWGVGNVQQYCKSITGDAIAALQHHGYWIEDEGHRSSHLFGIKFNGQDAENVKASLTKNNIYVSFRGDAIRVAPNIYNDVEDMNRLVKALIR